MAYSFTIPAGVKVLSDRRGLVELRAPAHIDNATRDEDGAYRYSLGRETYIASAGTVENVRESSGLWRHRDGLVWLGA